MKEQRLSWSELSDYLRKNHDKKGVVVFKQSNWEQEYTEESRSYIVSGDEKYFHDGMCGTSIWSRNLDGTDTGVRLDWYMRGPNGWEIDYCYILGEEE